MLTNNDILKKLRVAHKLRDEDIVKICELVDFKISKSALNDFFRKESHPKYVPAGDQILRNFLNGLIIHLRGPMPDKKSESKPKSNSSKRYLGKRWFFGLFKCKCLIYNCIIKYSASYMLFNDI